MPIWGSMTLHPDLAVVRLYCNGKRGVAEQVLLPRNAHANIWWGLHVSSSGFCVLAHFQRS